MQSFGAGKTTKNSKQELHRNFLPPIRALGAPQLPPVQFCATGELPDATAFLLSRRHWAVLEAKHSGTRYLTWQLSYQSQHVIFYAIFPFHGGNLQPLSSQIYLESSISKEFQQQFLVTPAPLSKETVGRK